MKITTFATDEDLETNGVWIDIGEGARLKIARLGNPNFQNYDKQLRKPYTAQIRKKTLPGDIDEDLTVKAMARTVLVGWEGIQDLKGKNVNYSVDKAYEYLSTYKDFAREVLEMSADRENFKQEAEEEAVKN